MRWPAPTPTRSPRSPAWQERPTCTQPIARPTAPVAVLEIHGTADNTVAYEGGTLDAVRAGGRWHIPAQRPPSPTGRSTTAVRAPRSSTSMSTSTPIFGRRTGRPRLRSRVGRLPTRRGRRAMDDPERRSCAEDLDAFGRRPRLLRRPPQAVSHDRPRRGSRGRSRRQCVRFGCDGSGVLFGLQNRPGLPACGSAIPSLFLLAERLRPAPDLGRWGRSRPSGQSGRR